MIQSIQKVERSIKDRREADVPLVNFWLLTFVLNYVTLGIYGIVNYFKLIGRIDKFIIRKKDYYSNLIDFTEKYAKENQRYDELVNELNDMSDELKAVFSAKIQTINAGTSLLLSIVTFGIYGFFVYYKLDKIWYDLQVFEQEFDDKLSLLWTRLGIVKYPINFKIDPSKNRNFVMNIVLSVVTFGLWGIVWAYKIHVDPDNLYPEFHSVEDTILQTIRQTNMTRQSNPTPQQSNMNNQSQQQNEPVLSR